ncbi:hypothetical protein GQ44DRAFT_701810, partial [Phaeosphaeriaceae sp. PMI808]
MNEPTLSSGFDLPLYSLRSRKQNRLIYDLKYHPMDDAIRPSQAAKRRSAHGEMSLLSDNTIEGFSVKDDNSDSRSDASEAKSVKNNMKRQKHTKKDRKRIRHQPWPSEPIRHSTRKISGATVSYDMNVHPQDADIEILSSTDDELKVLSTIENDTENSNSFSGQKKYHRICDEEPKSSQSIDTPDENCCISEIDGHIFDINNEPMRPSQELRQDVSKLDHVEEPGESYNVSPTCHEAGSSVSAIVRRS